ncbi:MAG: UDP-3-O-(3-hydroxymyristoyl)glucosamine N-acyltransferase [Terriglobales bacterium]
MKHTLAELATISGARLKGDPAMELSGIANAATAGQEDLIFVEDEKNLDMALQSNAGAVVAGEFADAAVTSKPVLITPQPRLAFIRAASLLAPPHRHEPGVHSSAVLHHSVKLGKFVAIQPHVVLTEGVEVGERTRIGPGTAVGANVKIGAFCNIAANVTIYPRTRIGDRVMVHAGAVLGSDGFGFVLNPETGRYEKFPQAGFLIIEDDVEIGANTTIDRGALGATVIGRGTKIDNLVHIAHNVRLGQNVVIAAQTGISGSSVIGDNVVLAGQVGVADHVRIEEGVVLGAQSGVPSGKVIHGKGQVWWGSPARPLKQAFKELAALARLAKKTTGE